MNMPRFKDLIFLSFCTSPSRLLHGYVKYNQMMATPLLCVCECQREGTRETEGRNIIRTHTGFLLFLFPFVWLLSKLLRDQMVFTSHAHSLSFFVAHSQEKSHLYPIKTSLSPGKLIACVRVCVHVISGG
ncbi:hypothetical protein XENORESO_015163 [Xenotaenia resolanae]|uniref:Uncharacterized protein n=1 Tax=Xenotaenia resolanae TaxID=208358 RepID=A0ABV0WZT6_9TELE